VRAVGPVAAGAAVTLLRAPTVVEVTLMSAWQVDPAARLATLNCTSRCPAVSAPKPPAPTAARDCTVPQAAGVKFTVAGAATLRLKVPSGSLTETDVNGAGLPAGLPSVSRSALVPPEAMLAGVNDFVTVGGA